MIDIHRTESDDPAFLEIVSSIVHGLFAESELRELHLVHIDNWFDHKWLRFSGKALGALGIWKEDEYLTVPAFVPSRVLSHQFCSRTDAASPVQESAPRVEIHRKQWSAVNLQRRLAHISESAAFVWYSSNTTVNRRGAVMAYVPAETSYDTWYVSFTAEAEWKVLRTFEITPAGFQELVERGSRVADLQDR